MMRYSSAAGKSVVFLSLWLLAATTMNAQDEQREQRSRPKIPAPELTGGVEWLNTAGPIQLSKLKGKVVLLDFWTYCCINCMHVLPDLAKLEEEFPNELVVIGVHSAKFEGEKVSDNIRGAIMRYDIKHPVVNDANMIIWRNYGTRSWPTLALIDPEGNFLGRVSGEGHYELLKTVITNVIAEHKQKGTLDESPLHFQLEQYSAPPRPLNYPGKVAVDAEAGRLLISDSTNNRLVIAKLASGEVTEVVGDGVPGLKDGSFDEARFNDPQGMAVDGDTVYLADTKNHVLRKLDLKARTVTTIAGTGEKGYERSRQAKGLDIQLASPWALLKRGQVLFIAMAGCHQIWKMDLDTGVTGRFSGSGREDVIDGRFGVCAYAQPSGLATDGKWLYVADSEVSAIRKVDLETGEAHTVVGEGLFEFGDVDGVGDQVRLQHALGVAVYDGWLYVADTYNNKIRRIDPETTRTETFLGDGKPGFSDDPPRFDEPAGLVITGDKMYVADTNNHAVRVVDIPTKKVETLDLKGLKPPKVEEKSNTAVEIDVKKAPDAVLKPGKFALVGEVIVPPGNKLNSQAPMSYKVSGITEQGSSVLISRGRINPIAAEFRIECPQPDPQITSLRVEVTYYPCETGAEGVCRVAKAAWDVPITWDPAGKDTISLKP